MEQIDDLINRNYSFASDDAKQSVRDTFSAMLQTSRAGLGLPELPSRIDRYKNALADCKASHEFKTNELFELAFLSQGDRRNG
jgi:hypothetical protein